MSTALYIYDYHYPEPTGLDKAILKFIQFCKDTKLAYLATKGLVLHTASMVRFDSEMSELVNNVKLFSPEQSKSLKPKIIKTIEQIEAFSDELAEIEIKPLQKLYKSTLRSLYRIEARLDFIESSQVEGSLQNIFTEQEKEVLLNLNNDILINS